MTKYKKLSRKRRIACDKVVSITPKGQRVGVYYADTDGSKVLFETTPTKARLIVEAHNKKYEALRKTA